MKRLQRRLTRALDWRLRAVVDRLETVSGQVARLQATLDDEISPRLAALVTEEAASRRAATLSGQGDRLQATLDEHVAPVLRAIVAEEAANRRRLHALRASPEYEQAWTQPDPLVSITVPTRARPQLLVTRALPSPLAQTHANLEIVVVGDAAGRPVADAVAGLGDPRVRWADLTQRLEAHPDPGRHWLVGSAMARNEASRLARGAWLLHFDDDDRLDPDAVAVLLEHARATHAEVAYGGFRQRFPDGTHEERPALAPQPGGFGWQGALVHAGLPFERELVAAHLGVPGDAWLTERMLRAGVRFAALDRTVWDYFPSQLWLA